MFWCHSKSGNMLSWLMATIWLLRSRCLKFNWWHFCYSITVQLEHRVVRLIRIVLEVFLVMAIIRLGWECRSACNNSIPFNCDKNLQWIQTVGCYSCAHRAGFSLSLTSSPIRLFFSFSENVLLSCLLYSLFFMLHSSIWNVGGTSRILNKLRIEREENSPYHE